MSASCRTLDTLSCSASAKVLSHAGIVRFLRTDLLPYFAAYASMSSESRLTKPSPISGSGRMSAMLLAGATFEARGYSAWDPTRYAFIKDEVLCIPTAFCSYNGVLKEVFLGRTGVHEGGQVCAAANDCAHAEG